MQDHNINTYEDTFYIIPRYIRKLPGLTLAYLDIYETIFQFWNKNKNCFLKESALCERTGYKRAIIYRAMEFFEKHNELKRVKKNGKRYLVKPEKIIETDCTENVPTSTTVDPNVYNRRHLTSTTVDVEVKNIKKEDNLNIALSSKDATKNSSFIFEKDERFKRFSSAYPRNSSPMKTWKVFRDVVGNNDALLDQILLDIELRKKFDSQWKDRKFIKSPAKYLLDADFMGEIFNAEQEAINKKQQELDERKARLTEQERLSRKRKDDEDLNNYNKNQDALAFTRTKKEIPDALKALKKLVGVKTVRE